MNQTTKSDLKLGFEAWQSLEHSRHFDDRVFYPSFCLNSVYNFFNEFRIFRKFAPGNRNFKLLDIGCATGEIYRYFKVAYPNIEYVACDISLDAIRRAKAKYPRGNFLVTDTSLEAVRNLNPHYILCRDVIQHQQDPFGFLKKLLQIASKGIFLRLRTRDKGKTVLNAQDSCQFNYGSWVPYIVINCDELVSFLKDSGVCSTVVIWKNYMPLGGLLFRYLPKDCYLEETGTAETGMYIALDGSPSDFRVIAEAKKEPQVAPFWCRAMRKATKITAGRFLNSPVWW